MSFIDLSGARQTALAASSPVAATAPSISAPLGGGLRATPPLTGGSTLPPNVSGGGTRLLGAALSAPTAIKFNMLQELGASVAPTNNTGYAPVGQAGSTNNAGNIAGATGQGNYFVDTAATFQAAHPMIGTLARVGLPAFGVYMLVKGETLIGAAAIIASAPLWYAKLRNNTTGAAVARDPYAGIRTSNLASDQIGGMIR